MPYQRLLHRSVAGLLAALIGALPLIVPAPAAALPAAPEAVPTTAAAPMPIAAAAAEVSVTISGQGFGHGRGMGQWGSYGYAVDQGWSYGQILNHFYGNTVTGASVGNPVVGVELTALRGRDTVLTGSALTVNSVTTAAPALLVRRVAASAFEVWTGPGCAGPWTPMFPAPIGPRADIGSAQFQVCEGSGVRGYRGTLHVVEADGRSATVNRVSVDDYLRGVVPKESPASWGSAGGGAGMNALYAQSVAARSYALAGTWASWAQTCDTTSCQVYGGAYTRSSGGTVTWVEHPLTDAAVARTSGQVRRWPDGRVVRTEFSASTGGYTVGGDFPAVPDAGDATSANPNRSWTATFTLANLAALLGTSPIRSWTVTARNGLGAGGGRVLILAVDTDGGRALFSGNQVRIRLGLRSDWFYVPVISAVPAAEARAFSTALYRDFVARAPDAAGLAHWTSRLVAGQTPRSVADAFSTSGERLDRMVRGTYLAGLRREPDAGGRAHWRTVLGGRGGTLTDLHVGVYGSAESFATLGAGSTARWIDGIYRGVIGRPATSADTGDWVPRVATLGRDEVVRRISQSVGARTHRLGQYYRGLLQRDPDPGGVSSFLPALLGRGDFDVPAAIASSAEYWDNAQVRFG